MSSGRWIGALLVWCLSGAADAADPGQPTERPDRSTPTHPAPGESKKKSDAESRAPESPPKAAPEDKGPKTEPLPPPPKPEPKAEDSGAKKGVTSLPLTIKLAWMAEPALFPYELEVEMDGQKAVLTGAVSSEEDKAKAADIAKKVDGVEAVVNKLSVNPALRGAWAKKQDEALTHMVKERLGRSETLRAVGFDVKVEQGVVTLSGKTRYQVIALEAAEAARQVPGVKAVQTAGVQYSGKD